jgi:hypothetical protein
VLLVVGGAPKVANPVTTVGALRSVGVRVPALAVRAMGAAEGSLGLTTLLAGGRLPVALVAASYAGFTGFVVVALRTGGALASCGCVGRPDTPPTRVHVAITAALAALAATAAVGTTPESLPAAATSEPGATALVLTFVCLACWLVWLAAAELPALHRRGPAART